MNTKLCKRSSLKVDKGSKVKRRPLKVFFCYSHKDSAIRWTLDEYLDLLEREGLIFTWYDGTIVPGTLWSETIQENLKTADIAIFLISKAFLKSEYIANVEMKLALELSSKGSLVLIPVLVEKVTGFDKLPIANFEVLPTKARPIKKWNDQAQAYNDVVAGIRRTAIKALIDSGGAFEPGCHYFTEAELVNLKQGERARTLDGLSRLRAGLVNSIPQRRINENLLVATWAFRKFGMNLQHGESLYYIAQILSSFDVIALQEIHRNLDSLQSLLNILGPEWSYFITDVTEGVLGNNERFAIIYYQPRVAFEHISGEIVLPDKLLINGRQFARKPLLASFRSGPFCFRMCTAHILYGDIGMAATRIIECQTLALYLHQFARQNNESIILAGDFNIGNIDSPAVKAFSDIGFSLILHPTIENNPGHYTDLIGLLINKSSQIQTGLSGTFAVFDHVFRKSDFNLYSEFIPRAESSFGDSRSTEAKYKNWRTLQISDHLPLWVELILSTSDETIKKGK